LSSPANSEVMRLGAKVPFAVVVEQVFALDSAIQWVAIEEAGVEPRWAWRDLDTGELRAGTTTDNALLIDPLTLMLAEGPEAVPGNGDEAHSHRLRFMVLDYVDLIQLIARLGSHAYISVAISPGTDAGALGAKLTERLSNLTHSDVRTGID